VRFSIMKGYPTKGHSSIDNSTGFLRPAHLLHSISYFTLLTPGAMT
jgi:hypothetical protein